MPEFELGKDAKLYRGAVGGPASTEVTNVRNLTLNMAAREADVTTRANGGWRATAATLRECSIEFQMVWDPTDGGFAAMRTAFLTSAKIALKALTSETGEGPDGDFSITNFSRSEELEDAILVDVTAKLAVFRTWVESS
ncbi:MAG: hypothetical protein JXO22_02860 [Phycisphaerae bacterium]|nr:hypothetical protein [Phycisphaerae bacterium]